MRARYGEEQVSSARAFFRVKNRESVSAAVNTVRDFDEVGNRGLMFVFIFVGSFFRAATVLPRPWRRSRLLSHSRQPLLMGLVFSSVIATALFFGKHF